MDKEQYKKLDKNTKIQWYINTFIDDLEVGFKDSFEFDEAFEKYIARSFKDMNKQQEKILKKQMGVE